MSSSVLAFLGYTSSEAVLAGGDEVESLEAEVRALERALATAEWAHAEARKREAEAAAAELWAAEDEHDAGVGELRRTVQRSDAMDARIRELEQRIKITGNIT